MPSPSVSNCPGLDTAGQLSTESATPSPSVSVADVAATASSAIRPPTRQSTRGRSIPPWKHAACRTRLRRARPRPCQGGWRSQSEVWPQAARLTDRPSACRNQTYALVDRIDDLPADGGAHARALHGAPSARKPGPTVLPALPARPARPSAPRRPCSRSRTSRSRCRPSDAADRGAQRGPEVDQRPGSEHGNRTAAVPHLGRPVELDDLPGVERCAPEVVRQVLQRGGAALVGRAILPHAGLVPADEAHQYPEGSIGRRRVEGDLDRADLAHRLTGET